MGESKGNTEHAELHWSIQNKLKHIQLSKKKKKETKAYTRYNEQQPQKIKTSHPYELLMSRTVKHQNT